MKLKALIWILGISFLAVGSVGVYDRLFFGHVNANYGSVVTWGLWVALYIYFIGLSAGSFLLSSLVYVFGFKQFERIGRLSVFTALLTLICALLAIWVDLGHMPRAWHVLVYPHFSSPMAWMIWLYSAYMTLLFAEFWLLMRYDFVLGKKLPGWRGLACRILSLGSSDQDPASEKRDRKIVKVLAAIGIPLAIAFHGGVGTLFGVVAARPFWHSGMFPILFLLGALVSGGALLIIASSVFQEGLKHHAQTVISLSKYVFALLLLDVLFQIAEMLVVMRGGIPGHTEGFLTMMTGPHAWVYWVFQVGMGIAFPLFIFSNPSTRNSPRWIIGASSAIVLSFVAVRLNIVIPGLAMEQIHGLEEAFHSQRVALDYLPSMSEWLMGLAITGFGFTLFALGDAFIPLSHHLDVAMSRVAEKEGVAP